MENHSVSEQLWLTKLALALTVEGAAMVVVMAVAVEGVGLGEDGRGDIRITLHLSLFKKRKACFMTPENHWWQC